jgi:hypothetical protein
VDIGKGSIGDVRIGAGVSVFVLARTLSWLASSNSVEAEADMGTVSWELACIMSRIERVCSKSTFYHKPLVFSGSY